MDASTVTVWRGPRARTRASRTRCRGNGIPDARWRGRLRNRPRAPAALDHRCRSSLGPALSDRPASLVYNGELYNYRDLSRGMPVGTEGDTEILLRLLMQGGPAALERPTACGPMLAGRGGAPADLRARPLRQEAAVLCIRRREPPSRVGAPCARGADRPRLHSAPTRPTPISARAGSFPIRRARRISTGSRRSLPAGA